MQQENSTHPLFGARLKAWWKTEKGPLKDLSDGLGISAQHLSAYISGDRKPTLETMVKLREMGADVNFLLDGIPSQQLERDVEPASISQALVILGSPSPDALGRMIGVTPREARDWISGKSQPTHAQLVRLFNEVARAAETIAVAIHGAGIKRHPRRSPEAEEPQLQPTGT